MKLGQYAVRTDPGRKRRGNEDSYVSRPPLFAIADGMGGARAGEVASALAAGALEESGAGLGGEAHVVELIQEANRRVHERASTDAETSGMGTTITVALIEDDGTVTMGHVGDSRAYLLRGDRLEQLTDDHSLVAELVRRGELSPQAAEVHPQRSVITRALGTDPDVDVDAFSVTAEPGDVFLICSDGLSDMVDGEQIEAIVKTHRGDLDAAARALVQAANRAGGEDNITAILFELVEGETSGRGEPDEQTRELSLPIDEEDTLHPEDGVAPPPPATGLEAPAPVDTMVVAPAEIEALTAEGSPEPPQAGIGRRLLALAVIAALVAVIIVLVWWGLAR
ncbi:MAG TPA: Stp1/IreP family PP2C-type Ser/Thr phosphatase [Gaiellaceae bacterium]|nr:Stp1/IreP family PP2C-type Ser/Thr phosphatase [Gaiellaceae bacterium]